MIFSKARAVRYWNIRTVVSTRNYGAGTLCRVWETNSEIGESFWKTVNARDGGNIFKKKIYRPEKSYLNEYEIFSRTIVKYNYKYAFVWTGTAANTPKAGWYRRLLENR